MEQQRIINGMAQPLADSEYGDLKHALNASQILIHKLEKHAGAVQITGDFRFLPTSGTSEITLLTVGRRIKDLTNKFLPGAEETKLHNFLVNTKTKGLKYVGSRLVNNRIIYTLEWMNYTFTLINLKSITQLPVAQIVNTGPTEFVDWLTSRAVVPNTLPWEYSISKILLNLNKNGKPVTGIKIENDLFNEIGYTFIGLEDRKNGTPDYWQSFKK